MNNLIKKENQKLIICLFNKGAETLASVFAVNDFNQDLASAKPLGIQILSNEQIKYLKDNKETLKLNGVLVIEKFTDNSSYSNESNILCINGSVIVDKYSSYIPSFIPSPYLSRIFKKAEIFSTQKIRGPNL